MQSEEDASLRLIDTTWAEGDYNRKGRNISSFPSSIQRRLDVLARTAAILGLDDPSDVAYEAALSKLSSNQLQVQLHVIHLKKAEEELRKAIAVAEHRQSMVASWIKTTTLEADTAALERQRRVMATKAKDYQAELSAIAASRSPSEKDGGSTIMSLIVLQENLRAKERDLRVLKAQLSAFEGLPPNLDHAKQQLKIARENQIRLANTREKLLGRMSSRIS